MKSSEYLVISILVLIISILSIESQAQRLSAGAGFAVFLCDDGKTYSSGLNFLGQLGNGDSSKAFTFSPVQYLDSVVALSSGADHTLALKSNGTVWSWGGNNNLQLGDGTAQNRFKPVLVDSLNHVVKVSAGWTHSLFLKSDSSVWGAGSNRVRELGHNAPPYGFAIAQKIDSIPKAIDISGGHNYSLTLNADSTVTAFGANQLGQLGLGKTSSHEMPSVIPGLHDVVKIIAGFGTSYAISANGKLWAWGDNRFGQLGLGLPTGFGSFTATPQKIADFNKVKSVKTGVDFTLILDSNGTVWGVGKNNYNQLGQDTANMNLPIKIMDLTNISKIAGGGGFALAMKSGTLYSWGKSGEGALGSDTVHFKESPSPVSTHSCQSLLNTIAISPEHSEKISVYPNPAKQRFSLQSPTPPEQVKLFTVNGQLLRTWPVQNSYNIANLPSGLYLLQVITEEGSRATKIWKR